MLRSLWAALLDILYPPKCPVCRHPVAFHGMWCAVCLQEVLAVRALDVGERSLKALDSCWAVCDYASGLKRIMHDIKFRRREQYGPHLSWLLTAGSIAGKLPPAAVVIVPVPLDQHRLAERGFNQTELIFRLWAGQQHFIWLNCLERLHPTQPQWKLNRAARQSNIRGAFRVLPECSEKLMQQDILLVDDILTTGITMDECARALKKAGASRVHGLVLASGAKSLFLS